MAPKSNSGPITWDPKVSAIVPCYNAAEFIQATLDCLVAQTWPNLEILIGDDFSTDATAEIVTSFAAKHRNVQVIARQKNLGWVDNTNDLVAHAAGELAFFAFHDDVVATNYVEKLVAALADNPKAVIAFSDVEQFELDGQSTLMQFTRMSRAHTALSRGWVMCRLHEYWWACVHGLFRVGTFHQTGGLQKHAMGEYAADWTWLLHMALLGDYVRVPETLCRKYFKANSLSKVWEHSTQQREAVQRGVIAEIWSSRSPIWVKFPLAFYLETYKERRYLAREYRRFKNRKLRRQNRLRPPSQEIGN